MYLLRTEGEKNRAGEGTRGSAGELPVAHGRAAGGGAGELPAARGRARAVQGALLRGNGAPGRSGGSDHAGSAGRWEASSAQRDEDGGTRSRMEMQHDQIDIEIPVSWSMDHPIYGSPQDGLKKEDKVSELPGQPGKAVFDQYAGYVTVDAASGKALFYYFAEAAEAPTKPLVLWLNGGPGCSSLGGAMLEIGPFYVNQDNKTLSTNKYAWNNEANMLFLESPAGVGFSYSNRTSDYNNTGDRSTAADAYTFLINWLERFPEYKGHDFFITGESYSGHYIPQLANTILSNNKKMNTTTINLKGVAIGNAYLDDDTNTRATIEYFWTHAMISKETHQAVQEHCSFNGTYTGPCKAAIEEANTEKGLIDQYNIYASFCWNASDPQQHAASVGGYVVGYDGLVFATVRGAGHMVPTYQPQRALTLFSSFLQGKLPPE
ncbi:hypothetical protein PR202_gn00394 [Eleusine coracana subsp. coracana]|uniref:Carboxypeptidase n=1 Tax=Eleusine coracana subsp. coracana TaxID=191504 RepID=A0AAV5FZG9_ELECO|nr:hypothetical protein PR202_gn00394 [Eleusine coracana subsp. coracana]